MKKAIILLAVLACSFPSFSQEEVGYNTTDVGAEFNHYSGGNIYGVHLAFNAKLHSSFIIRAGYNIVNENYSGNYQNEKGGGIAAGIGYRYYLRYKPSGFFIGARADIWNMDIDWTKNLLTGNTKSTFFIPAFETGYMLVANDWFFFTPSISVGSRFNVKSGTESIKDGLLVSYGFSAGFKIFSLRE